ncbi:hypothetical protein Ancab_008739, partial [Ancistrocladus abbreviatus]
EFSHQDTISESLSVIVGEDSFKIHILEESAGETIFSRGVDKLLNKGCNLSTIVEVNSSGNRCLRQ